MLGVCTIDETGTLLTGQSEIIPHAIDEGQCVCPDVMWEQSTSLSWPAAEQTDPSGGIASELTEVEAGVDISQSERLDPLV